MFSIALTAFVWGFGSARKYHNATCDETTCYDIEPTTSVHGFKISLVEHCHLMPSDCLHFRYKIEEIPCRGGRKGGGKGGRKGGGKGDGRDDNDYKGCKKQKNLQMVALKLQNQFNATISHLSYCEFTNPSYNQALLSQTNTTYSCVVPCSRKQKLMYLEICVPGDYNNIGLGSINVEVQTVNKVQNACILGPVPFSTTCPPMELPS